MSLLEISVPNDWHERLWYQRTKAYPLYVVEACRKRARLLSRKGGLGWPHYGEMVAIPRKQGLCTTGAIWASENKRYGHLPGGDPRNPLLPVASSPMHSCGIFRSFLARTLWSFNTCQTCYIVIWPLVDCWLTSSSVLVYHSLHGHTRYASNV